MSILARHLRWHTPFHRRCGVTFRDGAEWIMWMVSRLLACSLLVWHGAAVGAEVIRIPKPEFEGDRRSDYSFQLLQLALSKVGTEYRMQAAQVAMNQERAVLEIEARRTIDVVAMPSSAEREARLLPIRIPIHRGALGWRIGLIRKGEQELLATVNTLEDLKGVRLAQGRGWPDTKILQANGISVITAPRDEGLFQMLEAKRFDYFPRSVMEIWDEQANNADTLVVEPHLALHYYYDSYFMVNRKNTRLAQDIRDGLERAILDGSFDKLFQQYFGERIRKAHLETRTVIELQNPLLTPETPSNRPELWYDFRAQRRVSLPPGPEQRLAAWAGAESAECGPALSRYLSRVDSVDQSGKNFFELHRMADMAVYVGPREPSRVMRVLLTQ
jgi:ABC-type amino acid transport substrate-binding protein